MNQIPLPPELAHRTIPGLLSERARTHTTASAATGMLQGAYRTLTYAELDHRSDQLAVHLAATGRARPGGPVAWALDNTDGLLALVLYHAVLKAGAHNVPLNTRLTAVETDHLMEHCGATGLLRSEEVVGLYEKAGTEDRDGLPVGPPESQLASVLYTSGTTGLPKGVEHTHGSSIASGAAWADCFALTSTDVLQSPFPVTSGAGLHFNALSCLWAGAHVVVDGSDLPGSFERVEKYGSTVFVAVPAIYQYWLDRVDLRSHDLSTLRILDYGGSSMAPEVIRRLRELLPSVGLMQTYGFTEAGPGGTYLPPEYTDTRPGSIGNRAAGRFTEIRVLDDSGSAVGPHTPGQLFLRGPGGMRGYHRDPQTTARVIQDGWIASGDIVRYDEEGFLYFVDRRRELIVRGGYNIAPVEIEAAILTHPGVREAAVFGVPHPRLGEVPCAAVVAAASSESVDLAEELHQHLSTHLADFKRPRHIHVVTDLPKNAAGKVVKQHLRDTFSGATTKSRSETNPTRETR